MKKSDDFTLQLEVQNISKQPLQYDSNQSQFFDIFPEGDVSRPTWSDISCRSREAHPVTGGPITVEPGEWQEYVIAAGKTPEADKLAAARQLLAGVGIALP